MHTSYGGPKVSSRNHSLEHKHNGCAKTANILLTASPGLGKRRIAVAGKHGCMYTFVSPGTCGHREN
jgi:hypothetical protein